MSLKPDTKRILADSLEYLLQTQEFEEISIKDIIEHCGASRTTYYRHFQDKYDLVSWIYKNEISVHMNALYTDIHSWRDLVLSINYFVLTKKLFFKKIIKYNGQNSFSNFLYQYSIDYCVRHLAKETDPISSKLYNSVKIYCAGTVFIMEEWIKNNMKESPEEIADIICENMPPLLHSYFK